MSARSGPAPVRAEPQPVRAEPVEALPVRAEPVEAQRGAPTPPSPELRQAQPAPGTGLSIAIIGAGWSGLAAAVEATSRGHAVTVFEMAATPGGRARRLPPGPEGLALDNGQHILIGAYTETLRLMRLVGVDPERALLRLPLALLDAKGHGLALPPGPAIPSFVRGVWAARGWSRGDKLALLATAAGWLARGFRCDARLTVAQLTARLPAAIRRTLVEPLCVAALNTPADAAGAQVFLRVLRDALFAGRGASDLLLPRLDLGALFPDPAVAWLRSRGAQLRLSQRVEALQRDAGGGPGWRVEGASYDRVVLACSAVEAARLAAPHAPQWAATARALRHEPILTVLLRAPAGTRLPAPLLALEPGEDAPAQYVFDLGQLRDPGREPGADGVLAFVVSGAAAWVERGQEATAAAVQAQARKQLGAVLEGDARLLRTVSEKRATFLCTPRLDRPQPRVAIQLGAVGDYLAGPYPATLEGAVRSGAGLFTP